MQQEKMGCLLRELRKEKGMTQEQLAEQLGVSNRSVSRWENGINMPDISILVEISEFFEVGILELIEGERKQEEMDSNDLKKIANYSDEQKRHILNKINKKDVVGLVFWHRSRAWLLPRLSSSCRRSKGFDKNLTPQSVYGRKAFYLCIARTHKRKTYKNTNWDLSVR